MSVDEYTGGSRSQDREHLHVPGDLPTVFRAGPMFRRTVAGYDRFEVDTYVRWAEDELATADRERERLLTRHLRTRAELQEARRLLDHSPAGGDFLGVSRRIGSLLAAAADEAESMRAAAEAGCRAAAAQAEDVVARAERVLAGAEAEAGRAVAEAALEAGELIDGATRIVEEAEQTEREARAAAQARLEKVRVLEQRAIEHAERHRRQTAEEAAAARLQARDEIVRMLGTAREERRRADTESAAARERLVQDAAERRASLLAEVARLERLRTVLRAEVELLAGPVAAPPAGRLEVRFRQFLDRHRWRRESLRAP